MNDILEIINDLKEIREAVKNNESFFIKIDQKIDEILARIKNGDFDTKLFKDQKLALKNQFKTSRGSNNFWIASIADAVRHNLNFEQINNVDTMIESITLRDIVRLAKKNFDQNYINEVIKEAE